jgi:hypothetical protein
MGEADLARRGGAAAADHAGVAAGVVRRPVALEMRVVSRLSVGVNGGRTVGNRCASIDLPVPGLPIIRMI